MTSASYHQRGISRLRAEELLLSAGRDGSFLVRDSETVQGAYTLCLLSKGVLKQYRILPDPAGLYIQAEQGVKNHTYPDIPQLIEAYVQRGEKNGLICPLKYPVSREDDSDDEDDLLPVERETQTPPHPPSSREDSSPPQPRAKHPLPAAGGVLGAAAGGSALEEAMRIAAGGGGRLPDPTVTVPENMRHRAVREYVKVRYDKLDLSGVEGGFAQLLREYAEEGVLTDSEVIYDGLDKVALLNQLLVAASRDLQQHVALYEAKVELCNQLFESKPQKKSQPMSRNTATSLKGKESATEESGEGLERLFSRLAGCKTTVINLQNKAVATLKNLNQYNADVPFAPFDVDIADGGSAAGRLNPRPEIPNKVYEVRGKTSGTKLFLTVDIARGKLFAVKKTDKGQNIFDENNMFESDRVQQLIKSSKDNCRVDVKYKDRKNTERYVFMDARDRESFCQMVKQMKLMHNVYTEIDHLSIFTGTWNMAETAPHWNLSPWLRCQGTGKARDPGLASIPFDVYVIGTQETHGHEKDWIRQLQKHMGVIFGVDFVVLSSVSLWQIRLVILVKPEYKDKITHLETSSVATGLANALGNKGGVAISFTFNLTSFCFLVGHLAARHDERRNLKRNQNYRDIVKGMNMGPRYLHNVCDLTNKFHHVFFLGDLNYRVIDLGPEAIIEKVKNHSYDELLFHDQLRQAQKEKNAFIEFSEEKILFPPTYKYQKGSRENYSWEKVKKSGIRINAPSWCDRILHKSYEDTHILNTAYGAVQECTSSDHKPVFASFEVGIQNQSCSSKSDQSEQQLKIVFKEVRADVKSQCREYMQLEFHSSCLEKPVCSYKNREFMEQKTGFHRPQWKDIDIPQLTPLFSDLDYLEEQHIILAVKTEDGMESYGECVISLKSRLCLPEASFDQCLTHQGEWAGSVRGTLAIMSDNKPINPSFRKYRQKSYDFVYIDTDPCARTRPDTPENRMSVIEADTYSEPIIHDSKVPSRDSVKMRAGLDLTSGRKYSAPHMSSDRASPAFHTNSVYSSAGSTRGKSGSFVDKVELLYTDIGLAQSTTGPKVNFDTQEGVGIKQCTQPYPGQAAVRKSDRENHTDKGREVLPPRLADKGSDVSSGASRAAVNTPPLLVPRTKTPPVREANQSPSRQHRTSPKGDGSSPRQLSANTDTPKRKSSGKDLRVQLPPPCHHTTKAQGKLLMQKSDGSQSAPPENLPDVPAKGRLLGKPPTPLLGDLKNKAFSSSVDSAPHAAPHSAPAGATAATGTRPHPRSVIKMGGKMAEVDYLATLPPSPPVPIESSAAGRPPTLPPRRGHTDLKTTPLPLFGTGKDSSQTGSDSVSKATVTNSNNRFPSEDDDMHIYSGAVFQRITTLESAQKKNTKNDYTPPPELSRDKHTVPSATPQYTQPIKDKKKRSGDGKERSAGDGGENNNEKRSEDRNKKVPCERDDRETGQASACSQASPVAAPPADPPVLPPRMVKKSEPEVSPGTYDTLHLPASLDEWLQGLSLPHYAAVFRASGWDRLEYLDDITRADLVTMEITDAEIQTRIITSIGNMRTG